MPLYVLALFSASHASLLSNYIYHSLKLEPCSFSYGWMTSLEVLRGTVYVYMLTFYICILLLNFEEILSISEKKSQGFFFPCLF